MGSKENDKKQNNGLKSIAKLLASVSPAAAAKLAQRTTAKIKKTRIEAKLKSQEERVAKARAISGTKEPAKKLSRGQQLRAEESELRQQSIDAQRKAGIPEDQINRGKPLQEGKPLDKLFRRKPNKPKKPPKPKK